MKPTQHTIQHTTQHTTLAHIHISSWHPLEIYKNKKHFTYNITTDILNACTYVCMHECSSLGNILAVRHTHNKHIHTYIHTYTQ